MDFNHGSEVSFESLVLQMEGGTYLSLNAFKMRSHSSSLLNAEASLLSSFSNSASLMEKFASGDDFFSVIAMKGQYE